jgi:hypothetical protein
VTDLDWVAAYAEALGLELDDAAIDAVLALARDVAHGTERKNAPLASFLAGRFVGTGGSLSDAVERARRSLPAPDASED